MKLIKLFFTFFIFAQGIQLSCTAAFSDVISLCSMHDYEQRWECHPLALDKEKQLSQALGQGYRYLNAGVQSMAYLSEDGKYVIKFFKQGPFTCPTENHFFSRWGKQRAIQKRSIKRDHIFSAYRTACDKLSKETGVLYVHFNETKQFQDPLLLTDASGLRTPIALDNCDFIVQRRAVSLRDHLDELIARKDMCAAEDSIERLLALSPAFFHKGMRNRDIEFVNNYGFIDGDPVLFDVGRLLPCIGEEGKEKYQKKLSGFLPAFRAWIEAFYPMLIDACDAAISKTQKVLAVEPYAVSMTSFHPPEQKWQAGSLDEQARKTIDDAFMQPYHFLSQGGQSFVFVSADKKYVIKFFKQKIFSLPEVFDSPSLTFFGRWQKSRKLRQRAAKRDRIYSAYANAYEKLAKQTGILYVHFNTTQDILKSLVLIDYSGKPFSISLDDCDFVLERHTETIQEHLNALLAQGDIAGAGASLKQLLELFCTFYEKDVRNRDVSIINNYGFVDGLAVLFDAGRLVPCKSKKQKEIYLKRLQCAILPRFRSWIGNNYPMLREDCNEAMAEIVQRLNGTTK